MRELLGTGVGDAVVPQPQLLQFEVALQAPHECPCFSVADIARAEKQGNQIGTRADRRSNHIEAVGTKRHTGQRDARQPRVVEGAQGQG